MISTSVLAEWTSVTGSNDGDMTVYIDSETIKRKGNKVKIWSLIDYKTVQETISYRYLSSVTLNEYDCEEEIKRMLDLHWYSGNMRQGDIVYSIRNIKDEPESIVPGSLIEVVFKIACGKK